MQRRTATIGHLTLWTIRPDHGGRNVPAKQVGGWLMGFGVIVALLLTRRQSSPGSRPSRLLPS